MSILIQAKNISKKFITGSHEVRAVDGISFEIQEGELTVIVGPSGAGKTTLLNLLGGMDSLSEGSLLVDGVDIGKFNKTELTHYRRTKVGFVFQFYNLMPNLSAIENVELSTELKKDSLDPLEVLTSVGLKDRVDNFPSQLSGGEQQRVAIARAIVKNPQLLLCDEPTGALDKKTGAHILKLLFDIGKEYHKTVIIVTHNAKIADCAQRLIRISDGKIASDEINPNPIRPEDVEW